MLSETKRRTGRGLPERGAAEPLSPVRAPVTAARSGQHGCGRESPINVPLGRRSTYREAAVASFSGIHPSLPSEMLDRARASIPVERWDVLTQPAAEPLFPSRGHVGHCRICGAYGPMTEEHLPPKGLGNRWDFRTASFGQWIEADDLDVEGDGRLVQGGVLVVTCSVPPVTTTRAAAGVPTRNGQTPTARSWVNCP